MMWVPQSLYDPTLLASLRVTSSHTHLGVKIMAMPISKFHLLAVLLIFLQLFFLAIADPPESDLCNFDDESDLDNGLNPKDVSVEGCLWAGECKDREECGPMCSAMLMGMNNINPSAVKCVPSPAGGNHCCCTLAPPN